MDLKTFKTGAKNNGVNILRITSINIKGNHGWRIHYSIQLNETTVTTKKNKEYFNISLEDIFNQNGWWKQENDPINIFSIPYIGINIEGTLNEDSKPESWGEVTSGSSDNTDENYFAAKWGRNSYGKIGYIRIKDIIGEIYDY